MSEPENGPPPTQEQPRPSRTSGSFAEAGGIVGLIATLITYQLIKIFAPKFFSLELLLAAAIIGIGTALGFWLTRSRFHHILALRFGIALSTGQALGLMVALLITGAWQDKGLVDLGIMGLLTAWLFFRPCPTSLYVALAYQILSTGTRLWGMFGTSTVAAQLPWALSHGLAVWALIAAIRPLRALQRPQVGSTLMAEPPPSAQPPLPDVAVEPEHSSPAPTPLAVASEPVQYSSTTIHPMQVPANHDQFPASVKWMVSGTVALIVVALAASGGYFLGQKQGFARGHGVGVVEGENHGYEQGKKETEQRAKREMAKNAEAQQSVAFLAGYDDAMHEVWERFRDPMKAGRWYMIKLSDKIESGPLLLAEDGAKKATDANMVRLRLGILSDRRPPHLMIDTNVPMAEGQRYELRGDSIWGRSIR